MDAILKLSFCSEDFCQSHLQHGEVETKTHKKYTYTHPQKTTSWNPPKKFLGFERSLIRRDTHHPHLNLQLPPGYHSIPN